jgi:dipeptidase E
MRLFLSSYRAGNYDRELAGLVGGAETAVITNAKDHKAPEERSESVDSILDFLAQLAIKPVELDLRPYFNESDRLESVLRKYQAVWVAGGNTFILRRALKLSQADRLLYDMVRKNEIIYAGESAGAILATPTLTGVEHGDDPNLVPAGYPNETISSGLDFISYHIVPHYQSEWEGAEGMIMELKKKGLDYKTLTNEQAILINGDREEFLK